MNLFNPRDLPQVPRPQVPIGLNLDPTNGHVLAAQIEGVMQDVYHGMAMQADAVNRMRESLAGVQSDDIDVEHNLGGPGSYWSIPDEFEEEAQGFEGGVAVAAFIHARIEWNAGSAAYEWHELEWDAATDAWQDKTDGRSTAGITSATGSMDEALAKEQSDLEDLPDGLRVKIQTVTDDTDAAQYIFSIPLQDQDTPDAVGTADATDVAAATDEWATAGGTGIGCTFINQCRTSYNSTSHKIIAHFRTIQIDPSGLAKSISVETTQDILQLEEVTAVAQLQVTAASVQYKNCTFWAADHALDASWTNLTSTVCPP